MKRRTVIRCIPPPAVFNPVPRGPKWEALTARPPGRLHQQGVRLWASQMLG